MVKVKMPVSLSGSVNRLKSLTITLAFRPNLLLHHNPNHQTILIFCEWLPAMKNAHKYRD